MIGLHCDAIAISCKYIALISYVWFSSQPRKMENHPAPGFKFKGVLQWFSIAPPQSWGSHQRQIKHRIVKIGAAEAKIAWLLVQSSSKNIGPYNSHNATQCNSKHTLLMKLSVMPNDWSSYQTWTEIWGSSPGRKFSLPVFLQLRFGRG